MAHARIIGTGSYLPERVVTNRDLESRIDTTDEWIVSRTGIEARHVAADGEMTSDLAYHAASRAMQSAGVGPQDIDLIIVATTTPDMIFPSTACLLQAKLGVKQGAAFDVQAVCTGFMYALATANLYITSGQHRWVPVSPPLFDILQRSIEAARLSEGGYDITIGPVVRLWRQARKTHQFPDSAALRAALARTGYRYLRLDTVTHSVWLEKEGMRLDVGGLGKGFVAQAALDLLRQMGYPIAMVNAGGKIVLGQVPPGKKGWLIGINAPGEREMILHSLLSLREMAVATSGVGACAGRSTWRCDLPADPAP